MAREVERPTMSLMTTGAQTVATLLRYRATTTPDAPFLIYDPIDGEPRELTYRDMWHAAIEAGVMLSAAGVGPGQTFALALENSCEFFSYWFGAALTGAVMIPVNPKSTAAELEYYFSHAGCTAVICARSNRQTVEEAWAGGASALIVADTAEPGVQLHRTAAPEVAVGPRGLLSIMYTSGTTSRPKGVMVTHANYLAAGSTVAEQLRIRADDRWLVVLPLFHANAQYYCAMSALVSGASLAVSARFSASRWAAQARQHRATLASLFAAPIRMILAAADDSAVDQPNELRATVFAQNLTDAQLTEFEQRFGTPLLQLYGMTETMAPPLMNPLDGPVDNQTIGLPTAAGRVRIADVTGCDVRPGGVGELLIGGIPGETLMAGYLDDAEATAQALVGGWLHTGDLAELRRDGYVVFTDRAKDMIKRSGENVAAVEVERVINMHPEVFESAVLGVPDPVRDELIKAYVVRQNNSALCASELVEFCTGQLASGKVPDLIEFVDELPRTSVGKIRKHMLRGAEAPSRSRSVEV